MSGCSAAHRSWCSSSSSTPACPQLGLKLGVISSALIGLGVNEGAYLAEIIRAGISAVPRGQFEAARAIGMTRAVTMRVVVMPQALRIIIPPLGNAFNGLMKTSSLASVISMEELLRRTELLIQVQFKVLEIFIVAALYYLVLTTLWGFVQDPLRVEARTTTPTFGRLRTNSSSGFYAHDPEARGLGIYGVFWFGDKRGSPIPKHPDELQLPKSVAELEQMLRDRVAADRRTRLPVIVIDVSGCRPNTIRMAPSTSASKMPAPVPARRRTGCQRNLTMRLYAPKSDALTGKRKPSLVMKDAQPTLLVHSISLRPDAVLMPCRANLPVIILRFL